MNAINEKFKSTVRSRGFRVTPQRQIILEAIQGGNGHVALPEIIKRAQTKLPDLSLPTIYRTLDFLCEIRVVTALRVGNTTFFEIAEEEPHHHLVCRNCGAVEILPHVEVQNLFGKIERSYKFKVDMNHLGLFGLCHHCKAPSS